MTIYKSIIELDNRESLENFIKNSKKTLLLFFFSNNCPPCRLMKPVIGEISLLFPNDLLVINLNVEKFYSLASEHGIFSIPTIIMYKNGLKKTVINGAASVEEITKVIREIC